MERAYCCPVMGLDQAIDQATADLSLDNYPPYCVLENRLRDAIVIARSVGLGENQDIRKAAELSGLDEKGRAA